MPGNTFVPGHSLETALNTTWDFVDPIEAKARKTVQNNVAKLDYTIDYLDFYYVQPVVKLTIKYTKKMVKAIQDFVMGWINFYLLIIVAWLEIAEGFIDAFLPATTSMRARVISSMSTDKDAPIVRIGRHAVSIYFRPAFQVTQIPIIAKVSTKICRVAVLLSDELLGEATTDAILMKTEACMPAALQVDKPGTLRKVASAVIGTYTEVVAKQKTNAVIGAVGHYVPDAVRELDKVGSYVPAWQPDYDVTGSPAAQKAVHARRGVARPTQK
jgi:hypothetical protein